MAGLPQIILDRANEILLHHLKNSKEKGNYLPKRNNDQISIFKENDMSYLKDLKDIDVNKLTPLEALKILDDLKKKYE